MNNETETIIKNRAEANISEESKSLKEENKNHEDSRSKKNKEFKEMAICQAIIHLKGTKNNTMAVITDPSGAEVLFKLTGGMVTKKDREKSSQKNALVLSENLIEFLLMKKLTNIKIITRNKGGIYASNKTLAIRTILKNIPSNISVLATYHLNLKPHGFMRMKGGRRGRRV